ncbi:MAG: tetraacyldisaccharide 4'-kinase [Elusimicrobia bacterium]|nr:tetraacyldisaccharide 4'-kinase [Elusimicrobiota bacterium]
MADPQPTSRRQRFVEVMSGQAQDGWAQVLRPAAGLASGFYAAAIALRNLRYDAGAGVWRLARPVLSVGNLSVGGTGKTVLVIEIARWLLEAGRRPAVLLRGYKGEASPVGADEAAMLRQQLVNVSVEANPDRIAAGRKLLAGPRPPDVFILDDGFQHRRLARDLDVVLVNALDPFGGRALLPLGDLREPPGALRRAQLIVITHVDLAPAQSLAVLRQDIQRLNPRAPVLEAVHKPDYLYEVKTEIRHHLDRLQGRPAAALSGLASPQQFEACLKGNGVPIAQSWRYPDHHRYSARELGSIDHLRDGLPLVTTFKDLVKFPSGWRELLGGEVYALGIKLEIVKGESVWNDTLAALAGQKP